MSEKRYKSISKTQLAIAYNVSVKTFRLWLKPIKEELGKYLGKSYNPKQVEQIVNFLGEPENIEDILV
jgi:hypothetical protein